jgi:acetyl esterase/lipase
MKIDSLPIYPALPGCSLTLYRHEEWANTPPRPAVIVCPGGGYVDLSPREGEIVALQYAAAGFQALVLRYGVGENAKSYIPLTQVCSAIRYLRENAEALHVRPDRIFTTGFSAGGHCAASAGTMYRHAAVRAAFLEQYGDENTLLGRPDGMILCYPVISSGEYAHRFSFLMLCGDMEASEDAQAEFSLETYVDADTPPTFLWHTSDDALVPVQNALLFASALAAHHVPVECHIYPHGVHGLALCDEKTWDGNDQFLSPVAADWINQAIRWASQL